jgi:hypothetical protein
VVDGLPARPRLLDDVLRALLNEGGCEGKIVETLPASGGKSLGAKFASVKFVP